LNRLILNEEGNLRPIYPSLTGLRFVAAMSVAFAHCIALIVKLPDPTRIMAFATTLAECGMSLFFVLSGFVIHANYSTKVAHPAGVRTFFVARFARLYPLFMVFLCFDLLMKVGFHQTNFERLKTLPLYLLLTHSWIYLAVDGNSLIYQFGLAPQVTWSISTEAFFYVVFPLLCVPIAMLRTPRSLLLSMLALCMFAFTVVLLVNWKSAALEHLGVRLFGEIAANPQDGFYRWIAYFSPYARGPEFTLGCLISALIKALPLTTSKEQRLGAYALGTALLAACALVYLFAFAGLPKPVAELAQNFGFAPVLATIIFCCARYNNAIVSALSAPRVVLAGEASYSIYLSHMVVFGAFRYESVTITDPQIWIATLLQCGAAMTAVVGASLVLWALVEMPARRAVRRWLDIREGEVPMNPAVNTVR
jgi:peptidoglycan/LPS O-acetylase OafA/YrhL